MDFMTLFYDFLSSLRHEKMPRLMNSFLTYSVCKITREVQYLHTVSDKVVSKHTYKMTVCLSINLDTSNTF